MFPILHALVLQFADVFNGLVHVISRMIAILQEAAQK
jgi:hypothetical protein